MPSLSQPSVAWISSTALSCMMAEAAHAGLKETGGALLGYWASEHEVAVVTEVIGPGPRARHGRCRFQPDADYQEAQIAALYEQSGRINTYLGDWHTHPGAHPYPSPLDWQALLSIVNHPPARAPFPLMAILGGATPWKLAVWGCRPRGGRFLKTGHELVRFQTELFTP